jgi:hypothetical protein
LWPDADDDDLEPTVPAGLNKLSPAQKALAAFLRVDRDLLDVATQNSADLTIDESGLTKWVASLPVSEKDKLLIAAARGELANVGLELSRRFATARPRSPGEAQPRRRVVDLTSRARVVREQREEQERLARQAKRAREQAKRDAERKKYLAQLSARKHHAWNEIDQLILQKQKSTYDQAVTLLCDLKELAVQEQALEQFESRVRALRDAHRNKSVLMSKLDLKLPRINLSA